MPQSPKKEKVLFTTKVSPTSSPHLSHLPFDYIYMQFILIHRGNTINR